MAGEHQEGRQASVPVLPEYEVRGIFDVGYYEYNLSVIVTLAARRAGVV